MKNFNNNLKKYEFNMKPIKLFDSFAGIGALHQALKELGVPIELIGMSEIDIDAIISYGAIHNLIDKSLNFIKLIFSISYFKLFIYLYDYKLYYNTSHLIQFL